MILMARLRHISGPLVPSINTQARRLPRRAGKDRSANHRLPSQAWHHAQGSVISPFRVQRQYSPPSYLRPRNDFLFTNIAYKD
jgi:hypothetical protein